MQVSKWQACIFWHFPALVRQNSWVLSNLLTTSQKYFLWVSKPASPCEDSLENLPGVLLRTPPSDIFRLVKVPTLKEDPAEDGATSWCCCCWRQSSELTSKVRLLSIPNVAFKLVWAGGGAWLFLSKVAFRWDCCCLSNVAFKCCWFYTSSKIFCTF